MYTLQCTCICVKKLKNTAKSIQQILREPQKQLGMHPHCSPQAGSILQKRRITGKIIILYSALHVFRLTLVLQRRQGLVVRRGHSVVRPSMWHLRLSSTRVTIMPQTTGPLAYSCLSCLLEGGCILHYLTALQLTFSLNSHQTMENIPFCMLQPNLSMKKKSLLSH